MLSVYPACFFKDETGYSVIFPDLNFLSTCGSTLDEAMTTAVDCLAGYLYWLEKDGEPAPAPSALQDINLDKCALDLELSDNDFSAKESFVNMVTVNVTEYAKSHFEKSVKKTLSIPAWLNSMAIENNINFSQVLQEALKAQLHINQ